MKRRPDPKIKLTVYVSRIVAEQLDFACNNKTKNKSKLTETALSQLLNPKTADQLDTATSRRLDRLTRDVGVINRHQQIVLESLGLFIRHYLITSPTVPPSEQQTAQAIGHQRFQRFIEHSADGSQAQRRLRMKSPSILQTTAPSQTRQLPTPRNRLRRTQLK